MYIVFRFKLLFHTVIINFYVLNVYCFFVTLFIYIHIEAIKFFFIFVPLNQANVFINKYSKHNSEIIFFKLK
jgi:hypothetical protein